MESNNRYVCIFGAASNNIAEAYKQAAYELGTRLAHNGWHCINGGGREGIMGTTSNAFLDAGAKVTGIIPQFMIDADLLKPNLTEVIATDNIHQRKMKMITGSAAIFCLPGGLGTLEEISEIISWKQLGVYNKPVVIINVDGFFNLLLQYLNHLVDEQCMKPAHLNLWHTANTVDEAIAYINAYNEEENSTVVSKL